MSKINYFNYCALAIMFVLDTVVLSRHIINGRKNRYFWNLLLVITFASVCDILAVNLDNGTTPSIVEKYVAHCAYLVMINLSVPVYVLYLACLTDTLYKIRDHIWSQLLLALPYLTAFLLIVTTPCTHLVFYIDGAYRYTRGTLYIVLYIVSAFYMFVGIAYMTRCYRFFSKGQFYAMAAVFPILIIALGVQITFPRMRIEMFAHAVGILVLMFMVQKPEERINPITGFGRDSAYAMDIEQSLYNNRRLRILLVYVTNYKALRDVLGYQSMNHLMHTVSEKIRALCKAELPKAEPYYLGRGKFCLVVGKENFDRIDSAAKALDELLKEEIHQQDMDINLQMNLCIVRCPEDFNDFQSIYAFSNEFEEYGKNGRAGRIVQAEELLNDGRYIIKDIEGIIDNAMSKERMAVYYQPIYSVKEKRFVSAEALLRLNDEEYGHISPELFIPVAEKSGVIHQIGSFVLEEVCRFIASDDFKELNMEYVEVNLSVAQCMRSNLAKEIIFLLERYKIRPEQINLEITETAASTSQNIMAENIRILSEAGLNFSLDDFGTGYSNIHRMTQLPLNIVKLDKTFTDFKNNEKLLSVVRNTVKMVKEMGMKIVVEGIEDEEVAKVFSDLECDYIQGFYYAKPLTKQDFVEFVRAANAK
ncbi:MAG: EAL domain-containing protein [Lachnospiraceae bacterium]|nr:EAL domain-containing protein [Lachnospiraceae bacterium]